ncbi:tRNA lysidine(34) synthetase TilS [Neisseria sp. HMSC061H08]|uniref:tRNA lysidine(34) synthetase TilS n=1 Tax=Neisseria sp. HMSC061H08 TaxID=1715154 RepID=UPI0008AA5D0C|nr:tRNA lysidine(34) synthetase TilS [Neisseria sp. HMSC061H08]OHP61077.1 tRNA(Ile)-lysidine synthetase [Neisseria sp. HMSC061H08]
MSQVFPDFLFKSFQAAFPNLPSHTVVEVGLSGGLDSVVLLHLLHRMREFRHFDLRTVHVNHGLSTNADTWAKFCQDYCRGLNVVLRVCRVNVEKQGKGLEAAARAARYQAFSDGLRKIIVLAHHRNDQIETFMLSAVRGGGLRGMAAMPVWRDLNEEVQIWRPLLAFSRQELAEYAQQWGLSFVEDESNEDSGYLRNWMRNQALPQWQQRIPNFEQQICANVRLLQEDLQLLDELIESEYQRISPNGIFTISLWRQCTPLLRRRLLWYFLRKQTESLPSYHSIVDFARVLETADQAQLNLSDGELVAYRDKLFVCQESEFQNLPWCNGREVRGRLKDILLENGFVLLPFKGGLSEEELERPAVLRSVVKGDVIHSGQREKSVEKLLQECHIVPFVRKYWPIILSMGNNCLAVVNLRVGSDVRMEQGYLPVHEKLAKYIAKNKGVDSKFSNY